MKVVRLFALLVVVGFLFSSCAATRKQPNNAYLQGPFDTASVSSIEVTVIPIQKGDQLGIVVYSDNPAATAIYNQPLVNPAQSSALSSSPGLSQNPSSGYLVDDNGFIQFQGIGNVKAEGLTTIQLGDSITIKLQKYLTNPYSSVRILNRRITVMGEVMKPDVYLMPSDKVSVLQAIGLAGDLSVYGRKDNVLVVRETGGKRTIATLDLRDPKIFSSPFFYLQPNDMIIVSPTKYKPKASEQLTTRNISLIATIVTSLAIVYTAFRN